ncbi:MAG: DUF4390 domain-containing protein [Sterolibacterium sp.]|jgi:hypothetical protein|nr:DUF4390 domain-containing protein [Sterolibacterium sp.]
MPSCKNAPELAARPGWRALVLAFLLTLFSMGATTPAQAGSIEATAARLTASEETYVLSADFNIDLGNYLEDILLRGIPLYFQLEAEITRNRWFWPGEHVAGRTFNYRLAYIPLSRVYRLSSGGVSGSGLSQDFSKLADALRVMSRTVALPVAERGALKAGEPYQVAVRLSLDRQQLPKPLQLDAITNKDWTVDARVLRWQFVPGTPDRENRERP